MRGVPRSPLIRGSGHHSHATDEVGLEAMTIKIFIFKCNMSTQRDFLLD